MTGPSARALRVGVLLRDNLVEERVFVDHSPVTLGQSLRCRLSLPVDGIPHEHVLFARDGGRLVLRPAPRMTGRLSQSGTVRMLDGTAVDGIPLERGARGKLTIGEATILFQEVAVPPIAPRPQLPVSVRGTFGDRIDRRLAVIVGASLVVHLAIGGWAWMTEIEQAERITAPNVPYHHPQIITLADEPLLPSSPDGPGAATPVVPQQTAAPIVPRPQTPARPTPGLKPGLTTDDAARFAQLLTTDTETRGGPGGMRPRMPGADLDQQVADIRDNNRRVEVGNQHTGFREREREGVGTGPDTRIEAPTQVTEQGPRTEAQPGGRITLRPTKQPDLGVTLTAEMLLAKIQRDYMVGLKRCFQKGLATDPSLRGKIALTLTVDERGRVSSAEAQGLTPEVDSCIATQMTSWRFPAPKDKAGTPIDADFALALVMVPGS
ncbi:MAG: AgmX/PglI C-terminal domain-containing protein [Deltaproteobacteria bacterium]|nr:AgmX/PglI C-terminal domain-containing protein [Deltaproteobacteria bacterium]MDQ3297289.1 AgmX/PglI C-terminal domain-containing protein [Myxococcota bacterium]